MLRRLFITLAGLALLLMAAAGIGLWWLGTDSGLRFVVNRLQETMTAQGAELTIDEASGSLYRGVRIEQLSWRNADGMQVDGSDLVLRWSLPALLRRQVLIPELSAANLAIRLAPSAPDPAPRERLEMPGVLALPVSVDLQRLAIDELRILPAPAPGEPPPEPVVVDNIGARLAYRDGALVVDDLHASTPYGRLADARIEIGDRPPHPLQARLNWEGEVANLPLDFALEAAGDLEAAQASLNGTVADARIAVGANLAPLEVMPLLSAQADIANLDLRRLHESAPRTMIDAELGLAPAAADGWEGSIALRNQDAGTLPEGKLPLLALDTRLSLAQASDPMMRRLQLQGLQLTLPAQAGNGQGAGTPGDAQGNRAQAGSAQGRISGSIEVQPGRTVDIADTAIPAVQAALGFETIDLAQFGAQLPPTALDGKLDLRDNAFRLDLAQSAERMRSLLPPAMTEAAGAAEVVVRGRLDQSLLHLEEARLRLGETLLSASGQAGITAPHRIALKGRAANFELARWLPAEGIDPRWRDGRISGTWSIDGLAVPGLDAWVTLALNDSMLAGEPLAANVEGRVALTEQWAPRRLEKTQVDLRLGENRVRAGGALGQAGDKLALDLSLPQPGLLEPRLAGRLTLTGELEGAFDRLRTRVVMNGERLVFDTADEDGIRVASIRIDANGPVTAPTLEQAPLDLSLRLRNLETGQRKLDSLDLAVKGRLAEHRFDLKGVAEGHSLSLNGSGRASLAGEPSWQARLAATTLDGRVPIRLIAPATLRVDAASLRLADFRLAVAGGNASLEQLLLGWGEAFSFNARGTARDLPINRLLALADADPDVDALQALRLDADWNLRGSGAEDLDGTARVGLREVAASPKAGAVTAGATAAATDEPTGASAAGNGRLGLEGENGANLTFRNGRIDGRFDLRLPSLAFTHPLTAPDLVLDGRVRLAGTVDGPVVQPQWHATLSGSELSVLQRSIGWRLTDGSLAARLDGRKLQLQTFEFKSGAGSIALRGEANTLDAPRAQSPASAPATGREGAATVLPIDGRFELTASKFEVPLGPGQRVAVSGVTRLESSAAGLSLRGKLRVDHGIIEIQGSAAPALPDDVRLVYDGPDGRRMVDTRGRTVSKDGPVAEPEMPESRLRILTELAVDLGDRLRITGNGVAARLGGSLQVLGTLPDQPRLVGTVNILEGTYQAYGQNLRIDKGAAVRFNGPVDNPALDIVAKRPFLPVEVGVSISGTVLNPVITLVSTPDMPDTDKLSWLVLGTDPTNAPSAAQSLALREAARSLLLNDDGRHRPGIAERLGLDVMNFGYGSDTGPAQGITESKNPTGLPGGQGSSSASTTQQEVVTLGKRIGSRLFVSYEQGVRGLYNLLRIQYALSRRLSLRAQSGSDNAVDLLFSYSFD